MLCLHFKNKSYKVTFHYIRDVYTVVVWFQCSRRYSANLTKKYNIYSALYQNISNILQRFYNKLLDFFLYSR